MTTTETTTKCGRKLTFTATPDHETGRVFYEVAGVGTFTIGLDPYAYWHADQTGRVDVDYGRSHWARSEDYEDKPVVCRVQLEGGAVFHPSKMDPERAWGWLSVCRAGGGSAPDGTRKRTADIVHTLVTDWLHRPDYADLAAAHDRYHAKSRLADHRRHIDRLTQEAADKLTELAAEYAGARRQAQLLGQVPPEHPVLPSQTSREGQAIYWLRKALTDLRHAKGELPGGDTLQLLDNWFADLGIPLPD